MDEEWRDVVGYAGYYQVSNLGRIKSKDRIIIDKNGKKRNVVGRLMKPTDNGNGYYTVCLNRDGTHKRKSVHVLVAEAFLPNPNNYPEVNHKNENRSDNRLSNLEWCSYLYNRTYGTRLYRVSKSNSIEVNQYDLDWNYIASYPSIREAIKITGASKIGECCKGIIIQSGGYYWRAKANLNIQTPKNKKLKPVDQYTINGEFVASYNTIQEAAKITGISKSGICQCCKEKIEYIRGYKWKYKES